MDKYLKHADELVSAMEALTHPGSRSFRVFTGKLRADGEGWARFLAQLSVILMCQPHLRQEPTSVLIWMHQENLI